MTVVDLPRFEIWLYFSVWISSTIISVFEVYRNSRVFKKSKSWLHNVDATDQEWMNLSEFIIKSLLPACCLHFILSQFIRRVYKGLMFEINFLMSSVFYAYILGLDALVILYIIGFSFYLTGFIKSWALVWALAGAWRYFVKLKVGGPWGILWELHYADLFRFYILFSWILLRGIMYTMDVSWGTVPGMEKDGRHPLISFIQGYIRLMAYFLYIPSMLGSPLFMYKSFYNAMKKDYEAWTSLRVEKFVLSVVRYIFWWGLTEAIIRTFFNGKMGQKPDYLFKSSPWLLCGIAYMNGQFFMLKYVVFYGMTRPFALEDGIDYPEHPKCIARIYSYSAMWRHFDRGLYLFIRDYIYRPIIREEYKDSLLMKFISSFISFAFVFMYHGTYKVIFIWSVMNLMAVSIESIGKRISKSVKYTQLLDTYLSPRGQRRFHSLCMTPLLLFSFLSNIYFFIGLKPGHMYISRILSMSIKEQMSIFLVLYSGIQSSMELERKEMFKLH